MKHGHLIEFKRRSIFLQMLCRKWGRETSSRPLFIFQESLIWGKIMWSAAYFQYILIALNLAYNKNKLYNTLDYWSRDMLNFDFSEKCLALLSPKHFVNFQEKCFLCYFLLTDQISLSNYLYFSRYWAICVLQLFANHAVTP